MASQNSRRSTRRQLFRDWEEEADYLEVEVIVREVNDEKAGLCFDFHEALKEACKTVPGRTWNSDDKVWEFPRRQLPAMVRALSTFDGLTLTEEAPLQLPSFWDGQLGDVRSDIGLEGGSRNCHLTVTLMELGDDQIYVPFPYNVHALQAVKSIPGRKFDTSEIVLEAAKCERGVWRFPREYLLDFILALEGITGPTLDITLQVEGSNVAMPLPQTNSQATADRILQLLQREDETELAGNQAHVGGPGRRAGTSAEQPNRTIDDFSERVLAERVHRASQSGAYPVGSRASSSHPAQLRPPSDATSASTSLPALSNTRRALNSHSVSGAAPPRVEPPKVQKRPASELEDEEDGSRLTCKVCYSHQVDCLLLPCGHVFCKGCAKAIEQRFRKCAICNSRIAKVQQIYFS